MHMRHYFGICLISFCLGSIISSSSQSIVQKTEVRSPKVTHSTTALISSRKVTSTISALGNPVRLIIPSIKVDASVESLGIQPDGNLDTPHQSPWVDVGWYSGGSVPGTHGSAVIDGHLDSPGGYPAVFWSLRDIHVGDDVMIETASSKSLHFHVTRVAYYTPQNAPLQEIFGDTGGSYLNLITCAGDWIPSQHQTMLRLVVYTSLS